MKLLQKIFALLITMSMIANCFIAISVQAEPQIAETTVVSEVTAPEQPADPVEKAEYSATIGSSAFDDGTICADNYTDDFTDAIKLNSYRWEMENNTMMSVVTNDNADNSLTLDAGSVADGTFKKARYTLQTEVRLLHDAPWVIEWCSTGNWSGMLFGSSSQSPSNGLIYLFRDTGSKMLAFGEYTGSWNNYGLILNCDMAVPHVFRLENRIAPDGSNAVYLLVDGQEIDAMQHYYIAGTYQNSTVNWANGKDITFSSIGTSSHPMNGMQLEYLQVWESGHNHIYQSTVTAPTCTETGYTTYTCLCGSSYAADYVDSVGHIYENGICTICGVLASNPYVGKTIACIGDSITAGVGVTKDQTDYVTLLANSLEMNYIRLGASGTTLCTDGHATCNVGKMTEANLAGADVVTVLMGINDFVQARDQYYSLGTIDSTDTSTIFGAVHMWCQRISELRQTASLENTEFYFMTPVITSWNNSVSSARDWNQDKKNIHGYTLRDLCNAIIEVCALYDIPVIDLNLISGLYYNSAEDNNIAKFGGDGAHPGEIGHQMMAEAVKKSLLHSNLSDDHDHSYGSWITTTYPDFDDGEQQRVCSVCTATERRTLEGKGYTSVNGTEKFTTLQAALDAYENGTIQLLADADSVTVTKDAVVDLNGFNIASVTATEAELTILDTKTEDYSVEDGDYGKIASLTGNITPATGYIAIAEENGTSYHKVSLEVADMTLCSADAGIYYNCIFNGDEMVASQVKTCGVVLSLKGTPEIGASGSAYSVFHEFATGNNTPSTYLMNVMKQTCTSAQNNRRAEMQVYGRAYIQIGDTNIYGETVSRSFRQQVELADEAWNDLTAEQQSEVLTMYRTFQADMADWKIPNIKSSI